MVCDAGGLAAIVPLAFGVAVAAADELHQTLVASRSGSPWDVVIDLARLVLGLMVGWLVAGEGLRG